MTMNICVFVWLRHFHVKICDADVKYLWVVFFFPEEELRKLREETNVDSLRQELERERIKRLDLEQKMNEVLKSR